MVSAKLWRTKPQLLAGAGKAVSEMVKEKAGPAVPEVKRDTVRH